MIEDTILEKLCWQEFGDRFSYNIAVQKYNGILAYVFPTLDTTNFRVEKDGIEIKAWGKDECFEGISLSFWDKTERKNQFRRIEFKGTAKDFKAKVLQKFEALKSLLQEADTKFIAQKLQRIATETEITELTLIAKRAFDKYQVNISKKESGYRLALEIDFNDKRELLNFCDKENKWQGRAKLNQ